MRSQGRDTPLNLPRSPTQLLMPGFDRPNLLVVWAFVLAACTFPGIVAGQVPHGEPLERIPAPEPHTDGPWAEDDGFTPLDEFSFGPALTWWSLRPNEGVEHGSAPWLGLPELNSTCPSRGVEWQALARAFFIDDQRIEWSGQELTFGVEGVVRAAHTHSMGDTDVILNGEVFLNQPFDRNIYVNSAARRSYRANFEIEPFAIQQLYVAMRQGDLYGAIGRFPTPFGRAMFPIYTNDFHDAPFIRTESILWRETGALVEYSPGNLIFTTAIVNGGPERDTNSSKGIVARAGLDFDGFACGVSMKRQDGIGSETQKTYKNHYGIDWMFRRNRWTLSGELIYDEYGFRAPFNPLDITWGRSNYHRDLSVPTGDPLHGIGHYIDLTYRGEAWTLMLNYGEFYPHSIGNFRHDVINRRAIVKPVRHVTEHLDIYTMLLLESPHAIWYDKIERSPWEVLVGLQYAL